jgi:raffinose/stachyose/melibiose transport system permease protein
VQASISTERQAQRSLTRTLARSGPYLWVLPALALFAVFRLYPMAFGLYLSLFDWDGIKPMVFVGLNNYIEVISNDIQFRLALLHNAIYAVGTVVGKNVIAIFLAVLLNSQIRGRTLYRVILFMPVVMSFVVIALLWSWIFNYQFGLVNTGLDIIGLGMLKQDWLGDPKLALYSLMAVDIWKWYGFHMVIYLAGLQGISAELYEAAMIDGAGAWARFRSVTLPLLQPVTIVNVALSLMGAFNVFDLVYVMTEGGPAGATNVVLIHTYVQAFKFYKMGYGTAMSYVLLVIVMIISGLQIRIMSRNRVDY